LEENGGGTNMAPVHGAELVTLYFGSGLEPNLMPKQHSFLYR
jgi:hypothetical protein